MEKIDPDWQKVATLDGERDAREDLRESEGRSGPRTADRQAGSPQTSVRVALRAAHLLVYCLPCKILLSHRMRSAQSERFCKSERDRAAFVLLFPSCASPSTPHIYRATALMLNATQCNAEFCRLNQLPAQSHSLRMKRT